jgi:hypothetical protein
MKKTVVSTFIGSAFGFSVFHLCSAFSVDGKICFLTRPGAAQHVGQYTGRFRFFRPIFARLRERFGIFPGCFPGTFFRWRCKGGCFGGRKPIRDIRLE